tara:strand:- start:11 stop:133 length:123 start_codon:yes stop_codon:yes gene_type:complete
MLYSLGVGFFVSEKFGDVACHKVQVPMVGGAGICEDFCDA